MTKKEKREIAQLRAAEALALANRLEKRGVSPRILKLIMQTAKRELLIASGDDEAPAAVRERAVTGGDE